MKPYLFVGDTHGDCDFLEKALWYAREHDVHDVVQVGDFGFAWPGLNQIPYVAALCERYDVTLRWVCGNHDYHPWIREQCKQCDSLPGGGRAFAPRVIYQPRGSTHTDEDGTTFLFFGGAPSIDWAMRTEGRSVWSNLELASEEEHDVAMNVLDDVHVVVTHDAPCFPPGYGPKGDPWFRERGDRSMRMIADLVQYHEPEILIHGHWHVHHDTVVERTRVRGLDCNYARRFQDAVMLWSREE